MGHAALLLSAMGIVCRGVLLDFVIILRSISCIHKIPTCIIIVPIAAVLRTYTCAKTVAFVLLLFELLFGLTLPLSKPLT